MIHRLELFLWVSAGYLGLMRRAAGGASRGSVPDDFLTSLERDGGWGGLHWSLPRRCSANPGTLESALHCRGRLIDIESGLRSSVGNFFFGDDLRSSRHSLPGLRSTLAAARIERRSGTTGQQHGWSGSR